MHYLRMQIREGENGVSTFDCNLTEIGLCIRVEPLPLIQYHRTWRQQVKRILCFRFGCLFLFLFLSSFSFGLWRFLLGFFLYFLLRLWFSSFFRLRRLFGCLDGWNTFCLLHHPQNFTEIRLINHGPEVSLDMRKLSCEALSHELSKPQVQVTCHDNIS